MGQQQLLLLVLGIVIVGLAVVVGIQAFSENQQKANLDAMVNDGVRIASDLQAWSLKPQAFGGPAAGTTDPWTTADFGDLGYELGGNGCAATEYGNLNGCYTLAAGVITAEGGPGADPNNNRVRIDVGGTSPGDIQTQTAADGTPPSAPAAPATTT
ncbi:hypothetical protein [Rubrivirga sp. IMCC45206]|uniref:hypothetical protein n=1 Tax=Rubrivirga sp. IMCC45206 TaxID=3391614 RepID=UPI00398FF5EE